MLSRIAYPLPRRRPFALLLLSAVLVLTGTARSPVHAEGGYLLVADTAAEAIHVVSVPSMQITGRLDGVRLGAHAGTVALPDGRVLLVDDKNATVLALKVDGAGRPVVVGRAAIPPTMPWVRAAWAAVDKDYRYFAVSSDAEDSDTQTVTLVDLGDYSVAQLELSLNENAAGAYEEVHVYLGGTPLSLFATTGEEVRAYPVDEVFAGTATSPSGTIAIPANSHGPVFNPDTGRLYSSTAPGIAAVDLEGARPARERTIGLNTGGRTVGQNFRPRLSADGGYIYGAVTSTTAALPVERWAETENFVSAVNLVSETAELLPLGRGSVGRYQLSAPYALFWTLHPDGDIARLFDVDPASATFQRTIATFPLKALSNGPVAGSPLAGKESRSGAITPDGRWAFISHGGDSAVSAIDTRTRAVTLVTVPTPLKGGGYLVAVQPGARPWDLHTR